MSFGEDLTKARAERLPVMALRADHRFPDELDDIVVKGLVSFRAEAMDDDLFWMACRFANGEQLTLWVKIGTKPKRLIVTATEKPTEWIDLDTKEKQTSGP